MEIEKLKSAIESILFLSGEPVSLSRIAKITNSDKATIENAVMLLQNDYAVAGRGMVILKKEEALQMATHPDNAAIIDLMVKSEMQESLSKAALEVLAIVAYRGPISRVEVEAIRGVNSSFTLRSLLMRGLVERIDNPKDNRSYLYKISFDFLKKLGIEKIEQLPDFETLSTDERVDSIISNNEIQ